MNPSRKESLLSYERAHEILRYDPDSGVFVWRISRGNQFAYIGDIAGAVADKGYVRIHIGREWYGAHRLAWMMTYGHWPKNFIDHINGVPADNRLENLREADRRLNGQNQRLPSKNNTTGFLGVSKRKGNYPSRPFTAQIRDPLNKKIVFLGYYATPEEAHEAYLEKKRELHPGCTI